VPERRSRRAARPAARTRSRRAPGAPTQPIRRPAVEQPPVVDRAMIEQSCPHCGAAAGERCTGTHGVIVHKARADAWRDRAPTYEGGRR
jgi:hypothetical protein